MFKNMFFMSFFFVEKLYYLSRGIDMSNGTTALNFYRDLNRMIVEQ